MIVQYTCTNTGASTLSNVYAGIFSDWDVDAATYGLNKAAFDAALKMGYVWCTNANGLYVGIKLLTNSAPVNHYAIDNVTGGGGAFPRIFNRNVFYDCVTKGVVGPCAEPGPADMTKYQG